MQDMKIHDLTGIAESYIPLYPLSVGKQSQKAGWRDGVYGPKVDYYGINFSLSGRGEMKVQGEVYPLDPGNSVWHLPGEDNLVRALSDWDYYWVAFDGALAGAILTSYRYPRLLTNANLVTVEATFQELYAKIDSPRIENRRQLAATLVKLLAVIGGNDDTEKPTLSKLFLQIIEREYADPQLSVNNICKRLRVSPATLHRVITAEIQQSPGYYMRSYRIMRGHFLLRNTSLSVTEIAAQCGFGDENYFCRQIRRYSGCSPLEFRQREQQPQPEQS